MLEARGHDHCGAARHTERPAARDASLCQVGGRVDPPSAGSSESEAHWVHRRRPTPRRGVQCRDVGVYRPRCPIRELTISSSRRENAGCGSPVAEGASTQLADAVRRDCLAILTPLWNSIESHRCGTVVFILQAMDEGARKEDRRRFLPQNAGCLGPIQAAPCPLSDEEKLIAIPVGVVGLVSEGRICQERLSLSQQQRHASRERGDARA